MKGLENSNVRVYWLKQGNLDQIYLLDGGNKRNIWTALNDRDFRSDCSTRASRLRVYFQLDNATIPYILRRCGHY